MSSAAVVIIISRPQSVDPLPPPVVTYEVIGDTAGLELGDIVESVAEKLRLAS